MPERVDYSSTATPPNYMCSVDGKTGVKLWRKSGTLHLRLFCMGCGTADQNVSVSMTDEGQHVRSEDGLLTYYLGNLVPAVPYEENDAYWGVTDIPNSALRWWKGLPLT